MSVLEAMEESTDHRGPGARRSDKSMSALMPPTQYKNVWRETVRVAQGGGCAGWDLRDGWGGLRRVLHLFDGGANIDPHQPRGQNQRNVACASRGEACQRRARAARDLAYGSRSTPRRGHRKPTQVQCGWSCHLRRDGSLLMAVADVLGDGQRLKVVFADDSCTFRRRRPRSGPQMDRAVEVFQCRWGRG